MKFYKFIIISLIFLLLPVFASAAFYKYRDKNGALRFTDNMAEVPEDQRKKVTKFREIKSKPQKTKKVNATKQTKSSKNASIEEKTKNDPRFVKATLSKKNNKLEQEHQKLMQEKEQLQKMKAQISTPSQMDDYNKKARALNAKIKKYDEKNKKMKEEIASYNKMVTKQ